ncbi:acyl-CoA carboxylase epsilon subunit [Rathayibacter toxicus]|uniref:acyl-CoA carboxylase epsilon subunit n=1 Tax=Rathayibacter toxicus TaxID=145458 RepID=UPI001C053CDC|nr:acyl-CoA carboxylase epsilon subunit [Rathayibacter toxicus]QWL29738.1 acyl-CoA carboxylase subunit epsilon [Rathayibacter toxicus]QWL31830.1 acyl-CoA carboxylase subunit epsilon [Rathayibacter toxicus]QWL33923.1 acyl-CoA carboxylase subunit epsilon [Rathayibacter toxicus]QWL36055.1 acyl-CoA carboxylase subunit epsilon [Rathayibacter toxicus]QWL38146.1 acyl-CoA carboxylase subunit epsilon [Rathayibacter toxicus]
MTVHDCVPAVVITTRGLDTTQLAAVTAMMTTLTTQGPYADETPQELSGGWNDRAAALRVSISPAPGAWRSFSA